MDKLTEYQTILGSDGHPAFVVVPYDLFVKKFAHHRDLIPHEVVALSIDQEMSPVKAWRTHLGLTQAEVATRMGISQSAYAQQELAGHKRKSTREKVAAALGISPGQLDF